MTPNTDPIAEHIKSFDSHPPESNRIDSVAPAMAIRKRPTILRLSQWYLGTYCLLMEVSIASAQRRYGGDDYGYEEDSSNFFYQMIVGKFGAFLIVFMGFGGVATVFMTRQGKSSTRVPVMGILMLVVAAVIFAYRVMINAGFFGREHIRF